MTPPVKTEDELRAALQPRLDEADADWVMRTFVAPLLAERDRRAELADDYEYLRDHIIEVLNPRDDDIAEVAIMEDAIDGAVHFIERQSCRCTPATIEDHGPCHRYAALGRLGDVRIER